MKEYAVFTPETEAYINDMCRRENLIEYFKRYSGVTDQKAISDFERSVWDLPEKTVLELYMTCYDRYGGIMPGMGE